MDKLQRLAIMIALACPPQAGASTPTASGCLNAAGAQARVHAGSARDLYVATTGSNDNPGTRSAPLRTIARAAALATPGTAVHVAPGTYRESVTSTIHGASQARIRYLSQIRWGAKIRAKTEAVWTNKGSFTDITGFDISGSGRIGIANYGSHTLISGNHVHNMAISGGCTGAGGAGIVNANYRASDGDIVGNLVHDIGVPGECARVHGIYSSNLGGQIVNNIVYRASAYGIHLWHAANRVLIANNTVFANGASGIGGGIVIGAGDKPGGVVLNHTSVINNIVVDNPAASIREYCEAGEDCTGSSNIIANNLLYRNGRPIALRWGAAAGTISADPQFVHYRPDGSGNYRLKPNSPGINTGVAHSAPSTDIEHTTRPCGSAPDIGAYEQH